MTVINKSISVNATAQQVEAFIDNTEQMPEWFDGLESVEPGPGYPNEIGSSCILHTKVAGVKGESKAIITKREWGKMRQNRTEGAADGTSTWTYVEKDGVTEINFVIDYELGQGVMAKILDRLLVERTFDRNAESVLKNLKSKIEA